MALGDGRNPADYLISETGEDASFSDPDANHTLVEEVNLMEWVGESSERRRAARIQRVMPAGLIAPVATRVVVIDLSVTGLRIGCVDPLETHSSVQLELPAQPPLRLAARVAWCRLHASGNYEVGLQLAPLGGDQMAAYKAFLASPA